MAISAGIRAINASEHLTSLGWAGPGHSLDSHTSNRGLSKPLLVTHKQNTRGLGSRSAKERQADQWWLNAFDAALRQINSDGQSKRTGTSALERVQEHGTGRGGLYGWFKQGETMGSTFETEPATKDETAAEGAAAALVSPAPTDKESRRALIKAQLKRQRRQGAFEAPTALSPAERKQYSKNLRRQAKAQIKSRLAVSASLSQPSMGSQAQVVKCMPQAEKSTKRDRKKTSRSKG